MSISKFQTPFLLGTFLSVLLLSACYKVPLTGRSSLRLLPASQMNAMSLTQYSDFLQGNNVVTNTTHGQMVREVGVNIQRATEKYFQEIGKPDELEGFDWSFNLVQDNTINAWCMPGGRVVIYTGILPVCDNTDGLAVVMGHEIAHALAHHGNERMSQQLAAQLGGTALSVAMAEKPAETQMLFNTAYGLGTQVAVLLPFSRKHESEADEIGLYISSMAGYDPNEGAPFWQRMNSGAGGRPPQFLSTHPDPAKRSESLRALVPKAMEYARTHGGQRKHARKQF